MRAAEETLNLELKDLEQQLSEIENKLVASSEKIELLKERIVRRVKSLLGLSPLGLINRLLRGQVRPLLYIRKEDVSI
jgi:molecular chaperone GrpE (heat shock protein)